MSGVRLRAMGGVVAAGLLACSAPAAGWFQQGHEAIAYQAVALLPAEVPAFFRSGGAQVAHGAMDADLFKHPQLPELTGTEHPEHFINLERLAGEPLPEGRHALLEWLQQRRMPPALVGFLPYAVVEWTQRLVVAFAEYRRDPDDPQVQAKALVYAGMLAHYTGDLVMPLHTTVHYDGRLRADGRSLRSGLHRRMDALLDKLPLDDAGLLEGLEARVYEPALLDAVAAELRISHARVDRVYELEAEIPAVSEPRIDVPAVYDLARECYRHGVRFTASLFLTAWARSSELALPGWRTAE